LLKLLYGRHLVVDRKGQQFRVNGFRRVAKISKERGAFILQHQHIIQSGTKSLWWWKRCKIKDYSYSDFNYFIEGQNDILLYYRHGNS